MADGSVRKTEGMMKATLLVIVASLILLGAFYLSQNQTVPADNIDQLISKNLSHVDWSDDEQINKITQNWHTYTEDQTGDKGFSDRVILKYKEMQIGPLKAELQLRQYNNTKLYEITLIATDFIDEEKTKDPAFTRQHLQLCNDLSTTLTSNLDKAYKEQILKEMDVSANFSNAELRAQWKLNQTDLNFSCGNFKVYDGLIPLITVHMSDEKIVNDLQDLIYLKCANNAHKTGKIGRNDQPDMLPPLAFVIDPYLKALKSNHYSSLKTTTFTANDIRAESDEEKRKVILSIDRKTKMLNYEIHLKDKELIKFNGQALALRGWGECEIYEEGQGF